MLGPHQNPQRLPQFIYVARYEWWVHNSSVHNSPGGQVVAKL